MGRKPRLRTLSPSCGATVADGVDPVGAEVEVRCEDEGFRDAWYQAKVTRASLNRRGYHVVYTSLVTEEDPSKPLSEYVPRSHVRPRAPRPAAGARYTVHQLVDAFHNDGWWAGVISAVHAGKRYTVSFPSSREEIEFGPSEIRPRLAWVGCQWCPPIDQAVAKFAAGALVEVSGDRENYDAAWFLGTIQKVIRSTIFLVEYTRPKDDGDCESLEEILDSQYIRPLPPCPLVRKKFGCLSEVEAFHRCGWLVGVVSRILDDSRYIVRFRSQKEMEFHHSELRIHCKWINGRWCYTSVDKGFRRRSRVGKISSFPLAISTSSSSDDGEATYEPPLKMMILKRNKEGPSCEGQAEIPCKKRKEGDSSDRLGVELGPKTPIVEAEVHAAMPNFESPSSDFIATASLGLATRLPPELSFGKLSYGQTVSKVSSIAELLSMGEESSNFKLEGSEQHLKEPNLNHSLLTIKWGNSKGVRGPRGNALRRRTKLAVRGPRHQREVADVSDAQKHVKEGMKRMRGRPPKKSIIHKDASASVECKELQQLERITDLVAGSERRSEEADLSNGIQQLCPLDEVMDPLLILDIKGDSPNSNTISIQADRDEDTLEVHHFMPQMESLARDDTTIYLTDVQLPNLITCSFNSSVQEMSNFDNGFGDTGSEVETPVPLLPFEEGNAVIISNSFNPGVQVVPGSCNMLNASGKEDDNMALLSPSEDGSAVTQNDLTSGGPLSKRASGEESVLVDPSPRELSSTTLPFEKKSSLWESIESMEVFRRMPQRPHFCQLEKYSVEFREGMAIGLMVTFANLAANLCKLHISDSRVALENSLKALSPLEANGFDVQCVRSRMEELLEMGNNQRQFEAKNAKLKGQILERETAKDRLDSLDAMFDKTIIELEQHLARFREERDSVVMQMKNNESDIVRLQKDLQAVEQAYVSAEQHFGAVIASPW